MRAEDILDLRAENIVDLRAGRVKNLDKLMVADLMESEVPDVGVEGVTAPQSPRQSKMAGTSQDANF